MYADIEIDFQFDFDFKIWGVATNELQWLETCWSQTNEIWNFCSIHVPFCNHSKIFNKLFQTWMKFRNKIYPAFLFPFSIYIFFFSFGFYGPFKNIHSYHVYRADHSSKVGENWRTQTICKQNLTFSHVTRARLEPQRWETIGLIVNSPIHQATAACIVVLI